MKPYHWNSIKNQQLVKERGVSFEEVLFCIENGQLLDITGHHNRQKYKDQNMFVIQIKGYAYLVPFVETEDAIFLKTIIPSRKATRKYLLKDEGEEKNA